MGLDAWLHSFQAVEAEENGMGRASLVSGKRLPGITHCRTLKVSTLGPLQAVVMVSSCWRRCFEMVSLSLETVLVTLFQKRLWARITSLGYWNVVWLVLEDLWVIESRLRP